MPLYEAAKFFIEHDSTITMCFKEFQMDTGSPVGKKPKVQEGV